MVDAKAAEECGRHVRLVHDRIHHLVLFHPAAYPQHRVVMMCGVGYVFRIVVAMVGDAYYEKVVPQWRLAYLLYTVAKTFVGEGEGVWHGVAESLVRHYPRLVAAEREIADVPRLVSLAAYYVVEAVEGDVVVGSPWVLLFLVSREVNVRHYCLISSGAQIALHVGEVDVAAIEEGVLVSFFFQR